VSLPWLDFSLRTLTLVLAGKVYNVLHRIRVQAHEPSLPGQPAKCQCRAAKTGCGRADYIAEFYVMQDHWTKIIPVVVAQVYAKGSKKDGTKLMRRSSRYRLQMIPLTHRFIHRMSRSRIG
jgi:hypothetical protein